MKALIIIIINNYFNFPYHLSPRLQIICHFEVLLFHAHEYIDHNFLLTSTTPLKDLTHALRMIVFHNSVKHFVFNTRRQAF